MKNFILMIIIGLFCAVSMYVGSTKIKTNYNKHKEEPATAIIPDIGRIELLNGCGAEGAATKVADFLRSNNFDVKSVGNAETWNYPYTMVISRNRSDSIADQVAQVLNTDKMVKIRNSDNTYDVTVVIGPDYGERIK